MSARGPGTTRPVRLILALLAVAGLLVLTDRLAAAYVERRVGTELQDAQGLSQRPEVDIGGFPFLTQAVAGDYREVTVDAAGVDLRDGLRAERLEAVLEGARVPLGALLRGGLTEVPAERVQARALLAFDDLEKRVAPDAAESLELTAGEADDAVRVEALVSLLGEDVTLVTEGRVDVDGQQVRVTTGEVTVRGDADEATRSVLEDLTGGELDFAVDVAGLPFDLVLEGVQVTQEGLVAVVGGDGVLLTAPGAAAP